MIIYEDGAFVTDNDYPDTDFSGGRAKYVIPDGSELAEKVIKYFPKYKLITSIIKEVDENGKEIEKKVVIDVVKDDEYSEEEISEIKTNKKKELSAECERTIVAGVDAGDAHYSLTIEDQANILALTPLAQAGNSVFYHQDGEMCREYSSDEFNEIVNAATVFKTLQTTYCNLLMRQVEAMTDAEEVRAVKYGVTELTGEFAERYEMIKSTLIGDNGETNS